MTHTPSSGTTIASVALGATTCMSENVEKGHHLLLLVMVRVAVEDLLDQVGGAGGKGSRGPPDDHGPYGGGKGHPGPSGGGGGAGGMSEEDRLVLLELLSMPTVVVLLRMLPVSMGRCTVEG